MQTESNNAYRNDPLFPPVPKGYHERMEQVLEALPVDEKHTVCVPKKRGIILLAAAIAALLAVGTAVAVSMSTREQLNEVVEQRIEQSDDERYQKARELAISRIDADGYPHVIPLEGTAELDGVTLKLVSIEVCGYEANLRYTLESDTVGFVPALSDPDFREDREIQKTVAAFDTLCAYGEDACGFVLNVEGVDYHAYHGDSVAASGMDHDGVCTVRFLNFPWKLENGTHLTFSGTLYRCDTEGTRLSEIGSFSIPFVYNYTAELREAEIDGMAREYMKYADQRDAAVHDTLSGLPENATRIDAVAGKTTYLDVSADEEGVLLGLEQRFTETGWIDYTYFCMNGYDVAEEELANEIAPDKQSATKLLRLPYYADRQYIGDVVTIGCVRSINKLIPLEPEGWMNSDEYEDTVFVFRYNLLTGEVTLPKDDAERDAWFTPHTFPMDNGDQVYSFKGRYDVWDVEDVSDTQNGTTVRIGRVAFTPDGELCIVYRAENLACEVIAWETLPKAVTIDGVEVKARRFLEEDGFRLADDRIAEILNTYDMSKTRWITDCWNMKLPKRRDMYDGPITIEIKDWDLYDLNKQGEREYVGTFSFTFTIPVDDASYRMMSAGSFTNLNEH